VAMETTFQDLAARLSALREAAESLQITVVEDRPLSGGVLLVERLGNAVDDLRGWVEESLVAATDALAAVGNPLDEYKARNALAQANRLFLRVEYKFLSEEMSCDQLHELTKFGRRRGREWLGWSGSVIQALTQCRGLVHEVDEALLLAWQELSERLGSAGVSIQTTSIGQHITSAAAGEARPRKRMRATAGVVDDALN
jgi:hypothetical protein